MIRSIKTTKDELKLELFVCKLMCVHSARPTFCSPPTHNLSNFRFSFAHNVAAEAATEETCTQRPEVVSDGGG